MTGCKLIVHADDFGLSKQINEGILQAHRNGILTSCSVMVTGREFDHAVSLVRRTPTLDIGVHLTLVEEKPLSQRHAVSTLLDEDGNFFDHATTFMKRYFSGRVDLREVRHELKAQIERALDYGIGISHLDSHQHIHVLPGIWATVRELAVNYSIGAVRYPNERLQPYMLRDITAAGRLAQLLILKAFCSVAKKTVITSPDHFFGFFFGGKLNHENLKKILDSLPSIGTCELMCHPGLGDDVENYSHWQYRWAEECKALTDAGIQDTLEHKGVQLISYSNIVPLRPT